MRLTPSVRHISLSDSYGTNIHRTIVAIYFTDKIIAKYILINYIHENKFIISCIPHVRVFQINNSLIVLQVIKLYAWEQSFRNKIWDIRKKELDVMLKMVNVNAIMGLVWDMAPFLVIYISDLV